MTTDQSDSEDGNESNGIATLTEMLSVSVLDGVVVIPLILPLPKAEGSAERALFAKFQIHGDEDAVLFEAMVPLDVLAMLSLNLVKACATAVENVGSIREQDMLFVHTKDIHERLDEATQALFSLKERFEAASDT